MSDPNLHNLITEGLEAWDPERHSADVIEAHKPAQALGAQCARCPFMGLREGPVMPEKHQGRLLLVAIGEGPGAQEVLRGRPFIGPSGKELNAACAANKIRRSSLHITNATLCRAEGGVPLKTFRDRLERLQKQGKHKDMLDPVRACRPRLKRELEALKPEAILTLGATALETVAEIYELKTGKQARRVPGAKSLLPLATQRGHPFLIREGLTLLPTYHPAHALRQGKWMLRAMRRDMMHLKNIRLRGWKFEPATRVIAWCPPIPEDSPWRVEIKSWFKPEENASQYFRQLEAALKDLDRHPKAILTVDIETAGIEMDAGIRIVNLHFFTREHEYAIVVPLRWRDGTIVEPFPGFHDLMKIYLGRFLAKPRKLGFQNGGFDTSRLLRDEHLIDRGRIWYDTMIAHRLSEYGENRHSLGHIMADVAEHVGDLELHKDQFLHGTGGEKEG